MDAQLLVLWLHVLTGAVWYGGSMMTLVALRAVGTPAAAVAVARRFQRVAWAAFAVLLGTGLFNVAALIPGLQASGAVQGFVWTLAVKVGLFGVVVALTAAQQRACGRALTGGDQKALSGYASLGRINLLLGAAILLLGESLGRGGRF